MIKKFDDNRSNKFIFLPFCSLAQAFHARGLVKYEWTSVLTPIIREIINSDINIIQMPCPESLFPTLEEGLNRQPLSYSHYNNDLFRQHCHTLAKNVLKQIKTLQNEGYKIVCILGIQFSPSCAIDLQYTNKGNIKLSGIFIQELKGLLKDEKISIPFIGINRRGIKPSLDRLKKIIAESSELPLF